MHVLLAVEHVEYQHLATAGSANQCVHIAFLADSCSNAVVSFHAPSQFPICIHTCTEGLHTHDQTDNADTSLLAIDKL